MEIKKTTTNRGFVLYMFKDRYNVECSLQESSLATEEAIWFGCDNANPRLFIPNAGWQKIELPKENVVCDTRMHLTREQVKELLPLLQKFVDDGNL